MPGDSDGGVGMPEDDAESEINRAVRILRDGGLVAIPTETVYGLAADASNPVAVRRLYEVKGRPPGHPVIVHIAGVQPLPRWAARVPEDARRLAEAFWPGPLTLILPRTLAAVDEVTGGRETVGLRVPDHPLTLALLRAFGGGVAAPSANRFGRVSPTSAEDVRADLGDDVDLVLDGGPCGVGVESTIVDCSEDGETPVILRPGGITAEQIEAVLGHPVRRTPDGPSRAPGMLPAHYAPHAQVVVVEDLDAALALAAKQAQAGDRAGLLTPRAVAVPPGVMALVGGDSPEAYAATLYDRLRAADRLGLDVLIAVPPPAEGVGVAVRDRLARAAAGSEPKGGGS
ncbi:MAG: threonylcarbamoyl-AMP synthase [Dehalococcoidia bacterium]|nr:MAG: threonylcarbamoyl-AMP synthase [Dehalococcoidia bacterium]